MADDMNDEAGEVRDDSHFWIDCPGCTFEGKVGVPRGYPADVVVCPKCRQVIQVRPEDRVLWQPADVMKFLRRRFPSVDWDNIDREERRPTQFMSPQAADDGEPRLLDEPIDEASSPAASGQGARLVLLCTALAALVALACALTRQHGREQKLSAATRALASNSPPAPALKKAAAAPPPAPSAKETAQVIFARSPGMVVRRESAPDQFNSQPLVAPGRLDFVSGQTHRLKFSDMPGHEGVELYPTLELRPFSPRARALLGQTAFELEFVDSDYEQALSGNLVVKVVYLPAGGQSRVAATLTNTRLDSGGDPVAEAEQRGEVLAVLRVGNRDARLPPIQELFARANKRLEAGESVAAVRGFSDVIRAAPDEARGYLYRALANQRQGSFALAIEDLDDAIRLEPRQWELFAARSSINEDWGKLAEAVVDMAYAIKLAKMATKGIADAEVASAKSRLDELLELLYSHTAALFNVERYRATIGELTLILRLRPNAAPAYVRRASAYHKSGDFGAALADYNRALKLRPGPAKAFEWRSAIHERRGDYAAALADMRVAQRLDPARAEYTARVRWLVGRQPPYVRSRQVATR
jgi:tetratricopeptide (TPR) repeat protein